MLSERQCELISAFLDGEVTPRQRQVVLRLLRQSSEARALLQRLQENAFSLHQLSPRKLPDDFAQKVLGVIQARGLQPAQPATLPFRPKSIPAWLGTAAAAAVLLLVAAGSYIFFTELTGSPNPPDDGFVQQPADERPQPAPPEKLPEPKPEPPPLATKLALGALAQFAEPIEIKLTWEHVGKPEAKTRVVQELKQDTSYHVKVSVPHHGRALASLKTAMERRGIKVFTDPAADKIIKNRQPHPKTTFVLYTENLEPEEVAGLLEHLGKDKNIAPVTAKNRGGLLLAPMDTDQRKEMSRLLGLKGKQQLEKPVQGRLLDLPMAVLNDQKLVKTNSKTAQPARERFAVVLAVTPGAAFNPAANPAIRDFLNRRKHAAPGNLQVMVVLDAV